VAGEIFLGKKEGLETKPVLGKYIFFKKARTQYKRNSKIEEFKRQRKKQK